MGRPFSAALKISAEFKLEFDFGNADGSDDQTGQAPDFSQQTLLGPCPKCGSGVFELPMAYFDYRFQDELNFRIGRFSPNDSGDAPPFGSE